MPGKRQGAVPLLVRFRSGRQADASLLVPKPAVSLQALPGAHVRLRAEEALQDRSPSPTNCRPSAKSWKARVEKKKADADKPKQVNLGALAKKIKAQLAGIDVLERLTADLIRVGIGNMNAKLAAEMEEQAKQLGNAYLPGAQAALHKYTRLFAGDDGSFTDQPSQQRERIYSEALDQLSRLHALVKQGRAYLQRRLDDPELKPETESAIAAWLGPRLATRRTQGRRPG